MDPLYIFQKDMPTGKLAKRQILLSEFSIMCVTSNVVKGLDLANQLTKKSVGNDNEPFWAYFTMKRFGSW